MSRLKIGSLVLLGVATCFATTAAVRRARAQRLTPPSGISITHTIGPRVAAGPRGNGVYASGVLHSVKTEVQEGNVIHVAARASLFDSRPDVQYCWVVRMLDLNDESKVVWESRYSDQLFSLPLPEQELKGITFEDTFATGLPAGSYWCELSAFVVSPKFPAWSRRGPYHKEKVTLAN